jgi:hypothetical protein
MKLVPQRLRTDWNEYIEARRVITAMPEHAIAARIYVRWTWMVLFSAALPFAVGFGIVFLLPPVSEISTNVMAFAAFVSLFLIGLSMIIFVVGFWALTRMDALSSASWHRKRDARLREDQ